MLDLVALPKRYLEQMGRPRVAEIAGVSEAVLSMWLKREDFPLAAVQKLLEADPTPLHEIQPFYTNPVRHPKLLIIVPCILPPFIATTMCLTKMLDPDMQIETASWNSLYHVRNMAASKFERSGAEWSFWSDSDMIHPCGNAAWFKETTENPGIPDMFAGLHTIYRLLSHKKTLVSVAYIGKKRFGPAQFQGGGTPEGQQSVARGPQNLLVKKDWSGFGGILVHRSVFAAIRNKFPELEVKVPHIREKLGYDFSFFNPVEQDFGDDISFCARAKTAGHDLFVDLAVMSEHIGLRSFGYKDLR
jgi:hypothetical protein